MKKKYLILSLIIAIILIILFIVSMPTFYKTEAGYGKTASGQTINQFVTFAHQGYDRVVEFEFDANGILQDTVPGSKYPENQWSGCDQIMCIENNDTNGGGGKLIAIIDINKDGKNPDGATIISSEAENSNPQVLPDNELNKYLAAFAYYVEDRDWGGADGHCHKNLGNSTSYPYSKHPFISEIWKGGGYRDYIQKSTGINLPNSSESGGVSEKQRDVVTFAEEYVKNSNPSKTYAARIFIFRSGSVQARAVLFGKEYEYIPEPKAEIKKYITKVEYPNTYYPVELDEIGETIDIELNNTVIYNSTERSDDLQFDKIGNPVNAKLIGAQVTYQIEIENTGNVDLTGTFKDVPESKYLEYVSGTTSETITLAPGTKKIYTLVYRIKSSAYEGLKIENQAVFTVSDESVIDYEYIEIENPIIEVDRNQTVATDEDPVTKVDKTVAPTGEYDKYITKVTKPNGTVKQYSRKNLTGTNKYNNPVEVEKGDIVTYKIEFKNTSGTTINGLEFIDKMDSGLSYDGKQKFTHKFNEAITGGNTVSITFNATVTASNMTLPNLENKCYDFKANWEEETVTTVTTTTTTTTKTTTTIYVKLPTGEIYRDEDVVEDVNTDVKEDVTIDNKTIPITFTSNKGSDYVRLIDPEIAGVVWVEKSNSKNGLKNTGDTAKSGVTVRLYDENNNKVGETTTGTDGKYSFGKVQKGKTKVTNTNGNFYYDSSTGFKSYVVEFEYDGIKYEQTTDSKTSRLNANGSMKENYTIDSNASEINRAEFNKSLETIAYNKAIAGTEGDETSKKLIYDKSGHISTLKDAEGSLIKAKSFGLFFTHIGEIEYLKYINLGLIEREQSDLSLSKDVVSAKVSINGYTNTYNYEALGSGTYTGEYKLQTPYKLSLYKADYNFRYNKYSDTTLKSLEDELNIELTYKVTINNESDIYYAVLREIIDISSDSLELQRNSIRTNTGIEIANVYDSSAYNANIFNYEGYNTHYIRGGALETIFAPGETRTFYLTYTVNKDSNRGIILGEQANIAQIGAFSIYTDSSGNTPAGVIDEDSNPGIVNTEVITNITNDSLYEDHCYYTSIIIQIKPESKPDDPTPPPNGDPPGGNPEYNSTRRITGNVWEDLNTEELGSGQKTGDGVKDANENGAQNVTVVLLEVIEKNGQEYLVDTGIRTETKANGDYKLEDIYTGEFIVRFIYGNDPNKLKTVTGDTIRYSGQDYKSTVYTPAGNESNEDEILEVTAFRNTKINSGGQVSVARDNELRRLEVIDYSTTMSYVLDNVLKAKQDDSNTQAILAKNTSMFADTKKFNVQVEDPGNTTVMLSGKNETSSGLVTYRYTINEVNFGLLERPVTKLELMDDIKEITAITSTGEEIVHIVFDIEYKWNATTKRVERKVELNQGLSKGQENVQILDRTNTTKGFRYINMDTELLQGTKVTIKYQFAIANIGDIDTSNQNVIDMVQNYDIGKVTNLLNEAIPSTQYTYGNSGIANKSDVLKNYSFRNLTSAVNRLKTDSTLNKYKTIVSGITNNMNYELGYFLGSSYYDVYNSTTDVTVETRIDQILSYVDNDLVFKTTDNLAPLIDEVTGNEYGQAEKFLTYTIQEIKDNGLLRGVDNTITDEEARKVLSDSNNISYISENKNNLAFNVEDSSINSGLYKFLIPIDSDTNVNINMNSLYSIQLEASRVLSSQLESEDISLDNLSEIVKITNTIGRKAYIEFIDVNTGNILTPGASGPTGYLGNTPDILDNPDDYTVGQKEIDTNFAETVTFSPPTGLTQSALKAERISNVVIIVLTIGIVLSAGMGTTYIIRKKKFYK